MNFVIDENIPVKLIPWFNHIRIKIHPSYIDDIIFSLERLFKIFVKPEDFKGKLIILEKEGFFKLKA